MAKEKDVQGWPEKGTAPKMEEGKCLSKKEQGKCDGSFRVVECAGCPRNQGW